MFATGGKKHMKDAKGNLMLNQRKMASCPFIESNRDKVIDSFGPVGVAISPSRFLTIDDWPLREKCPFQDKMHPVVACYKDMLQVHLNTIEMAFERSTSGESDSFFPWKDTPALWRKLEKGEKIDHLEGAVSFKKTGGQPDVNKNDGAVAAAEPGKVNVPVKSGTTTTTRNSEKEVVKVAKAQQFDVVDGKRAYILDQTEVDMEELHLLANRDNSSTMVLGFLAMVFVVFSFYFFCYTSGGSSSSAKRNSNLG